MSFDDADRTIEEEVELAKKLEGFAEEWVAVLDHEVVAHDETLRGLLDSLRSAHGEDATVFRVPREKTAACFY